MAAGCEEQHGARRPELRLFQKARQLEHGRDARCRLRPRRQGRDDGHGVVVALDDDEFVAKNGVGAAQNALHVLSWASFPAHVGGKLGGKMHGCAAVVAEQFE